MRGCAFDYVFHKITPLPIFREGEVNVFIKDNHTYRIVCTVEPFDKKIDVVLCHLSFYRTEYVVRGRNWRFPLGNRVLLLSEQAVSLFVVFLEELVHSLFSAGSKLCTVFRLYHRPLFREKIVAVT